MPTFAPTMDKMTKEQRHRCMAAIHSKDTRPELVVRRYLFARGFRYRLCCPRLPGHPDLVLRKYRTVIFVNGCFWHGHEGCPAFRLPKTNTEFWLRKIERNARRDVEEQRQIAQMGWHCITVWECQLQKPRRDETLASLVQTLLHIYLKDRTPNYSIEEERTPLAAEPEPSYGRETK